MSKPNARKAAAAAIADADEAVKRRRRGDKPDTKTKPVAEPLTVTNVMFRDWIKRHRELVETNKKEPHSDFELLLIHFNEEIRPYAAGASAVDDILIPDDYVPSLFAHSGIDQLAKLFFNLDGQYYHDCSAMKQRPPGKYVTVFRGDIRCSHLQFNNFGRHGLWGPIVDYGFRQLSTERYTARGKVLLAAAFDFQIDGFTADIVAIVQSFFPTPGVEPKEWTVCDSGYGETSHVPVWTPLPDVKDSFFANGDLDALVRARIPWCWNNQHRVVDGNRKEYEVSPHTPLSPLSPSYGPSSPSYDPTEPSYADSLSGDELSPSDRSVRPQTLTGWESNTIEKTDGIGHSL